MKLALPMSVLDNLMRGRPIIFQLFMSFLSVAVCYYKLTRSRNNNSSYSVTFVQKNTLCENSNKTNAWAADSFASVDRLFLCNVISLTSLKIALALLFISYLFFCKSDIMFLP